MISSIILLLIDALVIFLSIGVGMRWHAAVLSRRQPKAPAPPDLTCGCHHELAYHDPATGVCSQTIAYGHHEDVRGKNGMVKSRTWVDSQVKCDCRQYTGELTADWYARSVMRGDTQKEIS